MPQTAGHMVAVTGALGLGRILNHLQSMFFRQIAKLGDRREAAIEVYGQQGPDGNGAVRQCIFNTLR